ncbi:MAG TPA: hypothetical protein DG942_03320 [Ruminococcaceae bacterium]|jgi:hypothetical protein|nr:hypothetical protein [Oscillospiraceae bacterium]
MSVFRKSRKGISLVEEICSVALLAIGVIAAVGAINLSRVSVTADTLEEAAAARAQKLEDNLVACLSKQPSVPLDMGTRIKGAKYVGSDKSKFDPANGEEQYVIEPAPSSDPGYLVFCRVYYDGGKRYVELNGFASSDGDSYAAAASGIPLKPIPIPPPPPPLPSHAKGLPFVLYGSQYGNHLAFKGSDDSAAFEEGDKFSDYPVIFGPDVQDASGKQHRSFSAPSMLFLSGVKPTDAEKNKLRYNSSIYACDAAEVTMKSNFFYIASKVITFKQDTGDKNATPKLYITPLDTSKPAYIYFAQDCDIIRCTNIDDDISNSNNVVIWHVKQGLYSFTGRQDLWKPCRFTDASSEESSVFDSYYVDYIVSTYKNQNLMAGCNNAPTKPYNGMAGWTIHKNGVDEFSTDMPVPQKGKDVYMYVNSTDGWGNTAQTYKANRIGLQYVAADVTFTLPKDKQVTFEAGTFGLNMQKGDGDVSKFKDDMVLKKSQDDTKGKFIVKNCSSLILYHGLNVQDSGGTLLYHLDAGEYKVKPGGFDLFDKSAAMAALGT